MRFFIPLTIFLLLINFRNAFSQIENSVLKSGKIVKAAIKETGIYCINYQKLKELGFSNPENVRVFGNNFSLLPFMNEEKRPEDLSELKLIKENNAIYFYAQNPDSQFFNEEENFYDHQKHLFSDYNYVFLSDFNSGKNNEIQENNFLENIANQSVNEGDFMYFIHNDLVNLQMSGRDWFGENFSYNTSQNFSFTCNNPPNSAKLKISVIARSSVENSFTITTANTSKTITCEKVTNSGLYASRGTLSFVFSPEETQKQNINITFNKTSPSAEGYLDFITLNTKEPLKYNGKQFIFSIFSSGDLSETIEFKLLDPKNNTKILNITDRLSPTLLTYSVSENYARFKAECQKGENRFLVFNSSSDCFTPVLYENIANQNLHGLETPDYLIIAPKIFLPYAQKLKELHSDLKTLIVSPEEIYNEFSSGMRDVSAIRDFIRFLYKKDKRLKYVLLFGDGSLDNKTISKNNTNLIPTYQSPNSLNENNLDSFVSDDFFGFLDDDEGEYFGNLDIGIGRLPVKNTQEAQILTEKIINYQSKGYERNWTKNVCFIADDKDNNLHISQADYLAENLELNYPKVNIKKIYADSYKQVSSASGNTYPEAQEDIINTFNKGALIINYTGHGGMNFFADERILTNTDIDNLKNKNKLPLFITSSCNIGHFDYYDRQSDKSVDSPAEHCLKNPNGGAIAMFTTTRNVLANENFNLNKNIFSVLFEEDNRFGDIIRKAKNLTNDDNMLNFTLLGDPALKLPLPKADIKILKINNIDFEDFSDTIKALGKYEISAEIPSMADFSGTAYIQLFDKPQKITTLNNDNGGTFDYQEYRTKIFDGISSVSNGKFSFKFLVPKDIDYETDFGKLSLYAENNEVTASGVSKLLKIGGSVPNADSDKSGPEIHLYLNSYDFISGGKTENSPTLIAKLSDTSGINISNKNSAHAITLTIDDEAQLTYTLTDYYRPDKDSYTSGKIEYGLKKLKEGKHTLKLKAWDNFNNSSQSSLDFIVTENDKLQIKKLLNYPNPFTDFTKFYFEHNSPQSIINYELTIFTVSGKIVRVFSGEFFSNENLSEPLEWDGSDGYGNKIARGVYFYRLKIKTEDGKKASKYEKLLYLK